MDYRVFGNTGLRVSVLGFGAADLGYNAVPQDDCNRMLNEALDAGLTVIDTAECYVDSEDKIGAAVSHRRKEFSLFTKVGHEHGEHKGGDWSEASITRTIERSLKRLRTDRVELVLLHSCKEDILRKGECIAALEKAKAAGKTRFIGYSGDSTDALYAINTNRFDALQTSVNIADQQSIELLLPETRKRNMGVIAKRPIANAAWLRTGMKGHEYQYSYWLRLQELAYDFLSSPASEAVAHALRFTISLEGVHTAIAATTKPGRWLTNAQSVALGPLPAAEIEKIRARWKAVAKPDWVGQV